MTIETSHELLRKTNEYKEVVSELEEREKINIIQFLCLSVKEVLNFSAANVETDFGTKALEHQIRLIYEIQFLKAHTLPQNLYDELCQRLSKYGTLVQVEHFSF